MSLRRLLAAVASCLIAAEATTAESRWPQFRGPNGSGVAETGALPAQFGPSEHVVWKTPLPSGHSSPCIWDDRIFLTGFADGSLETICIDRMTGRVLWRKHAPTQTIEKFHQHNNPASSTPTTDGRRVYVYFGSFGLLCYDFDGNEQWRHPLPAPVTEYGSASSPILAGDRLLLNCDQDVGSFLLAVDRRTGKQVWKTDRSPFHRGFATPMLWRHGEAADVVVPGSTAIVAYDPAHGTERWRVRGMPAMVSTTPIAAGDLLIVAAWAPAGDAFGRFFSRLILTPFAKVVKANDRDADGKLNKDEVPTLVRGFFSHFDADKDGLITASEWADASRLFSQSRNAMVAIRPGGSGDVTDTHVAWRRTRGLPYLASPLHYRGRVYLAKDGGILSCFDARTGRLHFRERLDVRGDYYASPVAGDGKVFVPAKPGTIITVRAGDTLEVLARNEFGEPITATPAIADGQLYVRTEGHLYAFGQ